MPKIRKNSQIHDNADANITCDFGDGDISRSRSRLPHTRGQTDNHIVSSITVRLQCQRCRLHVIFICFHTGIQAIGLPFYFVETFLPSSSVHVSITPPPTTTVISPIIPCHVKLNLCHYISCTLYIPYDLV